MAIATLALGIGGMTAMFSAFDTVLFRPLPYTAADELVMIWDDLSHDGIRKHFPSSAEMLEWRRRNTVFSDIASSQPQDATLSGDGAPDQVRARKATANFWSVLGVSPRIGRVFTAEEDDKGVRVLLISHGLWQRRFGGSPDVLGRTLTVNDNPYEVIGVMPQEFFFLPAARHRHLDAGVVPPVDADQLRLARRHRRGEAEAWRDDRAGQGGDGEPEPARSRRSFRTARTRRW